jgi:hypothetical protein
MFHKTTKPFVIFFVFLFFENIYTDDLRVNQNVISRVMADEIIAVKQKNDQGVDGVKVIFSVEASKNDVWKTITDYNNFYDIFGDLKLKLIQEDDKGAMVQASLLIFNYILYHDYSIPGEKLIWSRKSGDLKTVTGSWSIITTGNKEIQIIVYESYIDAGNSIFNAMAHANSVNRGKDTAKKLKKYLKTKYPLKK